MLPGSLTVCLNKCLTDFATKETRAQNILYSSNEFATKRSSVLNFARILFLYGLSDSKRPNRGVAVVVQIIRIRTASPPFIRTSNIFCALPCLVGSVGGPSPTAELTTQERQAPQEWCHKGRATRAEPQVHRHGIHPSSPKSTSSDNLPRRNRPVHILMIHFTSQSTHT